MKKLLPKILTLLCLTTTIASCLNSNRTNVTIVEEDSLLYGAYADDADAPTIDSKDSPDSNKVIIGKWIVFESPSQGTSLFVIYEENGKYYADYINNGIWSNDPYELIKTQINGNLGFKPVVVDEWSETYEIRENGVYAKNIDGTGGLLLYNAEDETINTTSAQKKKYDSVVNSYKCYNTGDKIAFYSNYTGLLVSKDGRNHDFTWERNGNIVTISYSGLGANRMTFNEEEETLTLKTHKYGTMVFE